MKRQLIILILVFTFVYAEELAEIVIPIAKLKSADIRNIYEVSDQELYLATQGAGILKSTNGGINFQRLVGSINNLEFGYRNYTSVLVDGSNIYAGGGAPGGGFSAGFNVSTDGGASFTQIATDLEFTQVIKGPQGKVYGSTSNFGVQLYENNSLAPFNNGLTDFGVHALYIDNSDGEPFYAGTNNGLIKYNYANGAWETTALSVPIYKIAEGENNATYFATNNRIYETLDNLNFNPLPDLVLNEFFKFTSLTFSALKLFATISPANFENTIPLVHSYNINTGNWADETAGSPVNYGIPQDLVISGNQKYLATTTNFYSGSFSGTWGYNVQELLAGQYTSASYNQYNDYFYAGGAQGDLQVSNDINGSWIKNDNNLKLSSKIIDFAHGSGGTIVVQNNEVNFQSNIGDQFERRESGLPLNATWSGIAYNDSSDVLVIGGSNGLSFSTDWGLQWQPTNISSFVSEDVKYSIFRDVFIASTSTDGIVRSDGNGETFSTLVGNITPTAFDIKDVQLDWKIGVAIFNDFLEIDSAGNLTSLGYTGLGGFGEYLETVNWSTSLDTWIGSRENKLYAYDNNNSEWDQIDERDDLISVVNRFSVSFNKNSNALGDETILVGTYGGGMYSNAALTSVNDNLEIKVNSYYLEQNYPNPFNPSTKISWQSPVSSHQTIKVYDFLGNEIITLVDEFRPAGSYEISFNGIDLASGIYFYQLQADDFSETRKMILLK
jgi:hypothetical protein